MPFPTQVSKKLKFTFPIFSINSQTQTLHLNYAFWPPDNKIEETQTDKAKTWIWKTLNVKYPKGIFVYKLLFVIGSNCPLNLNYLRDDN